MQYEVKSLSLAEILKESKTPQIKFHVGENLLTPPPPWVNKTIRKIAICPKTHPPWVNKNCFNTKIFYGNKFWYINDN
ncbi:unnamed protein product [Blepharisma stoltei]|uniref:Uncharacterized protein n=1 Tax=Blepharisma stoltei TaxID=1481888 RepID=A0AAU9KBM7_9CILI|nr:unnamed protein product [Blepharisma stoltei]